ncbi:MAG: calcium/sodium antiporter [Bernardetiaceae bacterium]|nr:calcium/sodium antiporter [Bernardetiaceae bacterium]
MWIIILKLIFGLLILIGGGEFLVKGATQIALRLRVSPLVIGLTVLAFGTSAPELFISIQSAFSGSPDLAIGNVVGSNICNLGLVMGAVALLSPIPVNSNTLKIDWPVAMACSLLFFIIALSYEFNAWEGVIFISLLISYLLFIILKARKDSRIAAAATAGLDLNAQAQKFKVSSTLHWVRDIALISLGGFGLYLGSDWFVEGAKDIAIMLSVSERVIGITMVALGTSLPELVISLVAAFRKNIDMAVGNLIGSNIFNILSIVGITSIIHPIHINDVNLVHYDMVWMLAITLILLPMMLINRRISRWFGFILIFMYAYYTFTVI